MTQTSQVVRQGILRLWNSPTVMSWGSLAARLSGLAVLLPLVLHEYSAQAVAWWLWLGSISMLQIVGDVGFSQTFARAIAFARGGARVDQLGRINSDHVASNDGENKETLEKVLKTMGPVYLALAFSIVSFLAVFGTWFVSGVVSMQSDKFSAWIGWCLVVMGCACSLLGNSYLSFLIGSDRVALVRRWEMITGLAGTLSAACVVVMGGSLLALIATQQLWVVFAVLRNYVLCRSDKDFNISFFALPDKGVLNLLWPPAWRSGVGVLMGFGIIQAFGLVYAHLVSLEKAASFLLAWRLIQAVSQLSQAPFYSKVPALNRLRIQGRYDDQMVLAKRGMKISLWAFMVGAVAVPVVIVPVLSNIESDTKFVDLALWSLIASAFYIERVGGMHMQLYSTTNHILWHVVNGLTGAAMIIISMIAYGYVGAPALPVAMLFSYALVYYPMTVAKSSREFGFSIAEFERGSSFMPFLAMLGVFILLMNFPEAGGL